ncbi:MAG: hypothetical protein JNL74_22890 [Fibrobacteres bacterium]|nr:hypothetical protein [Fibrobacterota bacterium]
MTMNLIFRITILIISVITSSSFSQINWTWQQPLPQGKNLHSITYGNKRFIAVGDSGIVAFSIDGKTWLHTFAGISTRLNSVTFGNNMFVAVGDSGMILKSIDGVLWNREVSNTLTRLNSVTYGNKIFVAVGGWDPIVITSADGVSWTMSNIVPSSECCGLRFTSVTYANDRFILVGGGGTPSFGHRFGFVYTSMDGNVWKQKQWYNERDFISVFNFKNLNILLGAFAYNVSPQHLILTSHDDSSWNVRDSNGYILRSASYDNNNYLVVGDKGKMLTSENGISWANIESGTTADLYSIVRGDGALIVTGNNGIIGTASLDDISIENRSLLAAGSKYISAQYLTSQMLSIKINDNIKSDHLKVTVYTVLGEALFSTKTLYASNQVNIRTPKINSGVYVIGIEKNNVKRYALCKYVE